MLLERLPELAKKPARTTELYDLYDLLVEGWLTRESRWIAVEDLTLVSFELALQMYSQLETRRGRMTTDEIEFLAKEKIGTTPNWGHLTARSLLNRDSRGFFKFAHKSILEFLVVKMACEGDDRAIAVPWTPFMKELFVSWGHARNNKEAAARARAILRSDLGRGNVTPLCDMLGTAAVRGYPDFKRCAERRFTSMGERLAPSSWRSSGIQIHNEEGRGIFTIVDSEYNLTWSYIPSPDRPSGHPVRVLEALQFERAKAGVRFPSFEQFVSLVEGLNRCGNEIIPNGRLFILEDKPGRHLHLIAQINSELSNNRYLRVIDRQRRINNTKVTVNCYITGVMLGADFARHVKVDQLYVEEELGSLL
jgi:hypothetical protein